MSQNETQTTALPDPEVRPKAKHRQFTAEYKKRILDESDVCTTATQRGALVRREGLYSSHLIAWRRQRAQGVLDGLTPKKRGAKSDPLVAENARLQREIERLQARLQRAETIIEVQKKVSQLLGLSTAATPPDERKMIQAIPALAPTIGITAACEVLGLPRTSFYRAQVPAPLNRPSPTGTASPRALTAPEKAVVRETLNSERFQDQAPREVYATLLDEDRYLCSWRTMYRILAENQPVCERRNQLRHPAYAKPELLATQANQLWSWDITKLRGPVTWTYYYLYVILDVYSRYVVGWMIAERESEELAQELIRETCRKQGIQPGQSTLHADNGSAMIAKSVAQLLVDLDVVKSHSRPHVSDDNPFSEAQFKTLKYRPDYPDRFGCLIDARAWAQAFFAWYNQEHHHTNLGLLTPAVVHAGQSECVRQKRQQVLDMAYAAHPERFVKGAPVPAQLPVAVWINPPEPSLSGALPVQ